MPTSKAVPVSNFRPAPELTTPASPDLPSSRKLLWDYPADQVALITGFRIEHSIEGGAWEEAATPPKDKREVVVGGYVQGALVKFRIIAIRPP